MTAVGGCFVGRGPASVGVAGGGDWGGGDPGGGDWEVGGGAVGRGWGDKQKEGGRSCGMSLVTSCYQPPAIILSHTQNVFIPSPQQIEVMTPTQSVSSKGPKIIHL